jgi:hypothetical protein
MRDVSAEKNKPDHPDTGSMVSITINGKTLPLHRGRTSVAELKVAGGVNPVHELEQVEAGQLQPLPDEGAVTLKGGEVFVSHPRDSASS